MSNPTTTAFPFEKVKEGCWAVYCDGTVVHLQTGHEAELLANLPVEYAKIGSGSGPDPGYVQKILAVCNAYDLYKMFAVRQLDFWLRKQPA